MERAAVEIVSLHCVAIAETPRPALEDLARRTEAPHDPPPVRKVYFPEIGASVETQVFLRWNLPIGYKGSGPAVVEEYGSTTVIGPWDTFEVGVLGEIAISIDAGKPKGRSHGH
jgi:N-methylhydantoinase A